MSLKSSHSLTDQKYVNLVSWFHTWANTCLLYNTQWFNSNILIIIGPKIPISLHCNRRVQWGVGFQSRPSAEQNTQQSFPIFKRTKMIGPISMWIHYFDQSNGRAYLDQSNDGILKRTTGEIVVVLKNYWELLKDESFFACVIRCNFLTNFKILEPFWAFS